MMRDERIIECMAKVELGEDYMRVWFDRMDQSWLCQKSGNLYKRADYLTDHNACIRVFKTLTTPERCVIVDSLIGEDMCSIDDISIPRKWCEAILKTKGLLHEG